MSTMGAREQMLGRLRAAVPATASDVNQIDRRIDAHFAQRRQAAPLPNGGLVRAMQAAMTASHATVWCADRANWPAQVAARLAETDVARLLLDPASPEGKALALALPPDIEAVSYALPLEAWKSELFDTIGAGFTVARSGIASTGTLVLAPDAGSPRTVSLVPPLHIALVYADTLHPDLAAAAKAERWRDGMPSNLVLASGPSKTSDIQQTLAYGAHGPRWMWVVIITGAAPQGAGA